MKTLNDLLKYGARGNFFVETKMKTIHIKEFDLKVKRIAHVLSEKVTYQSRILLYIEDKIENLVFFFAAIRVGAIPIIINQEIAEYNLTTILNDSTPELVIYDNHVKNFDNYDCISSKLIIHGLNNDNYSSKEVTGDVATIIYTSGSTGSPKGIVCKHKQIVFCIKQILDVIKIESTDKIGTFLPLSFDYGLYQFLFALYKRVPIYLGDKSEIDLNFLDFLKNSNITIFPSMPSLTKVLIRLAEKKNEKSRFIRVLTSTGEHFNTEMINKFKSISPGTNIFPMYGLTECKRVSILKNSELDTKIGSVGRPLKGTECFVQNSKGEIKSTGKGILLIKGPNVMEGYWGNENDNSVFFEYNYEKYLKTEDVFFIDHDNYLYFCGRIGDLYKKNGYRIYGNEIESACFLIGGIEECALVILNNSQETDVILFVKSEKDVKQIREELKKYIESYKIPKDIKKVDTFPLTPNGKIDKKKLGSDSY